MQIVDLDKNYKDDTKVAICLGNFDGIHIAHKALINSMVKIAKELNVKTSILLFENHTRELTLKKKPRLLITNEDKLNLLEDLKVDIAYRLRFDDNIMNLSPEDFVKNILVDKLNVKSVTVGFDYKFGHKASGDVDLLKKLGEKYDIYVDIVNPIYAVVNNEKLLVSSTMVRESIKQGNVDLAYQLLGRYFKIKGEVVPGYKRGRVLGFPTANVKADEEYVLPKEGIYATHVTVDGKTYLGATNVGRNLTFEAEDIKIETYIIDFSEEIYGKVIEIEFIKYIREEVKFNNKDDLIKQIEKDIKIIKSI